MQRDAEFRTSTNVLGIDPGLDGGMSVTCAGRLLACENMPTYARFVSRSRRRYFDTSKFADRVREWRGRFPFAWAAVENVHASPQMGVTSAFSFGHTFGLIKGVLDALGVHIVPVEPSVWKPHMALSSNKETAKARATQIFNFDFKNDGTAEAALVGFFQQRRLFNSSENPLS